MKDVYLVFKGADIQGETTDSKHAAEKAIEVSSWSHVITQPKSATGSSAGNFAAERTEHGAMMLTKEIDKASAKLWQAASAGTVYNDVIIYFYRALGGKNSTSTSVTRVNYLKIELKNVVVSSVASTLVDGNDLPSETIGLVYSAIKWTYVKSTVEGGQETGATGMWNLKTNNVTFA